MKRKQVIKALQQVADENGMSLEMVINEIERVIEIGMQSPDPEVQARWEKIRRRDKVPTAVELMEYLIERLGEQGFRFL